MARKKKDAWSKYTDRRNEEIQQLMDELTKSVHGSAMIHSTPLVRAVSEFIEDPTNAGKVAAVLGAVSEMHTQEKRRWVCGECREVCHKDIDTATGLCPTCTAKKQKTCRICDGAGAGCANCGGSGEQA